MAKTKLTDEIKLFISENYTQMSIGALSRLIIQKFEMIVEREDSFRRLVSEYINKNIYTTAEPIDLKNRKPLKLNKSKFYLFTWEQNNSKLNTELWNNILAYKNYLGAELAVILGYYRNYDRMEKSPSWNTETEPYWDFTRHDIHRYVNILSDINVQPTAEYPLSGLDGISRDKTSIIGHPKRHFTCLPVLEGAPHKALFTTMAITYPNYSKTKAGKKAEFNHKNGFIIIEIRNDKVFHIRQVEANSDGSFTDLIHFVGSGRVCKAHPAKVIAWGDIHVGHTDDAIVKETNKFIINQRIPVSILHDLADGESVNNHIVNNPIEQYSRYEKGNDDVFKEIEDIKKFVQDIPTVNNIIVNSNHDNRFDRWIINQDWKRDIKNAPAFFELAAIAVKGECTKGVLGYVLEHDESVRDKITVLGLNDSFRIDGIELAHHGHIGISGSKGSLKQFKRLNIPTITGHSHSPGVYDDAYAVGTSTRLRLGYNNGASDWMQGHCLINNDGKVQHILFSKGKFTTFNL